MTARSLLAALLPASCLLCGLDAGADALCPGCIADLPALPAERCPVCALPSPAAQPCGDCLAHPKHYDATHAAWRYGDPLDQLIQQLKYARRLAAVDFLARSLPAQPSSPPPDLIVPVPLAPRRLAERGFNQAVELARPLARATGARLLLTGIRRERDTPPQAALPWQARARNIRHAFACDLDLTGKTVWLVDDVMTTGATLNELAAVIKRHGAARVECRVVARALRQ